MSMVGLEHCTLVHTSAPMSRMRQVLGRAHLLLERGLNRQPSSQFKTQAHRTKHHLRTKHMPHRWANCMPHRPP